MSDDIDFMTIEPQTHKCPNCGKYVIVDAMCFECATAYQKGLRRGRVEELEYVLNVTNLGGVSIENKIIEIHKYCENKLKELEARK